MFLQALNLDEAVIPAAFQFPGDETVTGIDGVVLPAREVGLVARLCDTKGA